MSKPKTPRPPLKVGDKVTHHGRHATVASVGSEYIRLRYADGGAPGTARPGHVELWKGATDDGDIR